MTENEKLVNVLIKDGWLKSKPIINAFLNIKREDFVPVDLKKSAYLNEALPIGFGQTISQPLVVAFMLELLSPQVGEKILDVGAGSGWTTALLAYLVSSEEGERKNGEIRGENKKGRIVAIEIVPELKEFGQKNVAKYNFIEKDVVNFICADGAEGYKKEAPYDKILCSASLTEIPSSWKEQLKVGGRIVTPMFHSIFLIKKESNNQFTMEEFEGFSFVPFVRKK